MIERRLALKFKELANKMLIVALVGPRQSGKTTLVRAVFSELE